MIVYDDRQRITFTTLSLFALHQIVQPCYLYLNLSTDVGDEDRGQAVRNRRDTVHDHRRETVKKEHDFVRRTGLSIQDRIRTRISQRSVSVILPSPVLRQKLHHRVIRHSTTVQESCAHRDQLPADRRVLQHDRTIIWIVHRLPILPDVLDTPFEEGPFQTKAAVFDRRRETETNWAEQLHFYMRAFLHEEDVVKGW